VRGGREGEEEVVRDDPWAQGLNFAFLVVPVARDVTRGGGGFQVPTWRSAPFPRSEELIRSRSRPAASQMARDASTSRVPNKHCLCVRESDSPCCCGLAGMGGSLLR
jgi:hypothetical protein